MSMGAWTDWHAVVMDDPEEAVSVLREHDQAIERLTAENTALCKDAERYRWLRGSESVPAHSIRWARWEIRHWQGANGWRDLLRSELDVAIDAAMGESHE
jgi:hypothetical protein